MPQRPVKPRRKAPPNMDRKTLQLCHQVAEELQLILLSECEDDVLRELTVESVLPAPNAARLLISVSSPANTNAGDLGEVLLRLQQAMGLLRSEVARSITRRKAPELLFRIVQPGEGHAESSA